MACTNPIYALDLGLKENGSRNLKLLPKRSDLYSIQQLEYRYGKGSIISLPCGKCLGCKEKHSREWAVRCCLEASLYQDNCFITLTFSDDFLPKDMEAAAVIWKKFRKSLQMFYPGVRYFACCERGDLNNRIHFHALLFGYDLSNDQLKELWKYGISESDSLSYGSCLYVARYVDKKKGAFDGFIRMSNRPGLGADWLKNNMHIFNYDSIVGSFGSVPIPRYFEKIAVAAGYDFTEIKEKRIDASMMTTLNEMLVRGLTIQELNNDYRARLLNEKFKHRKKRSDL